MNPQRLSSGARFQWRSVTYQISRLLPEGKVNLEELLTGAVSIVEMSTLVRGLFDDELHFLIENKPPLTAASTEQRSRCASLALSDYPAELVAIARYRLEVIRPLLRLENRTRIVVSARVQAIRAAQPSEAERTLRNTVGITAVYGWIRDYVHSGNDLRALIPAVHERGGKNHSRLRAEVNVLVESVLKDKGGLLEKITIDEVRNELAVRLAEENRVRPASDQLHLPSRATLARRWTVSALNQTSLVRRGSPVLTQYGQTPYPDLPLERVEIDHTRSDLVVIDDRDNLPLGRLTLTYCLDLATRYPLGYYLGFEPPSYLTVMECLHHAILPKGDVRALYGTEHAWQAYGIPATLVIDNGKEFIGHDLENACCLLGTVLQYSPVLTPQFKAGVERMFGSMNTLLFHTLPGTTFSNPMERGRYDSAQQACVYLSEVDKIMHLFVVDIYAERFHRGLNGIPARCWEDKTSHGFAPALPPSAQELSIWLSRTDTRVIHPYGIEFASLRYNGDDLLRLRTRLKGQPIQIKYHPADLSYLYVLDPFEQQYLRVPALDREYTQGLSLWKHRVIRQAVLEEQAQVDPVALGLAKRKIQAIVDEGRQRKHQQTRARIARWDTAGRPTRQVVAGTPASEIDVDTLPAMAEAKPELIRSADQAAVSIGTLDDAEWEVSYLPLKSLPAPVKAKSEEARHG
jgi:putative transposase